MTSFVFRETLMTHLLLWGNAYAQIIRNGKGEVVALYPLMPNRITVNRDDNGNIYYKYLRSMEDAPLNKNNEVILYLPMCFIFRVLALMVLWVIQPYCYGEECHRYGNCLRGVRSEVLC